MNIYIGYGIIVLTIILMIYAWKKDNKVTEKEQQE